MTRIRWTEYAGDDGYTTLQPTTHCPDCGCGWAHCDCDSNDATHDRSRNHIRSTN